MEDALRWGVEHIFSRQHHTAEPAQDTDAATAGPPRPSSAAAAASPHSHGDTKMEDALSPPRASHPAPEAGAATGSTAPESTPSPKLSASPEPSMQSPFGSPEQQQQPKSHSKPPATNSSSVFQPVYTDRVVEKLLEWSVVQSRQAKAEGHSRGQTEDKAVGDSGDRVGVGAQSLGKVLGHGWSCVKLHEWQQGQLDDEAQADEGDILRSELHNISLWCIDVIGILS